MSCSNKNTTCEKCGVNISDTNRHYGANRCGMQHIRHMRKN